MNRPFVDTDMPSTCRRREKREMTALHVAHDHKAAFKMLVNQGARIAAAMKVRPLLGMVVGAWDGEIMNLVLGYDCRLKL